MMESRALFAIGKARGMPVGAACPISEPLSGEEWVPQFRKGPVEKALDRLLETALQSSGLGPLNGIQIGDVDLHVLIYKRIKLLP